MALLEAFHQQNERIVKLWKEREKLRRAIRLMKKEAGLIGWKPGALDRMTAIADRALGKKRTGRKT